MRLYLARHGDAVDKETAKARGLDDRPLSEPGEEGVERVARDLSAAGVRVERVLHSDKIRAIQTGERLSAALCDTTTAERSGLHPRDPVEGFLADIGTWSEDTLVVGHLPFMEIALSTLITGNPKAGVARLAAGAVACLERDEATGTWTLLWLVSPDCVPV